MGPHCSSLKLVFSTGLKIGFLQLDWILEGFVKNSPYFCGEFGFYFNLFEIKLKGNLVPFESCPRNCKLSPFRMLVVLLYHCEPLFMGRSQQDASQETCLFHNCK